MAKIFDVSTINGSRDTEKTAGIESTAKATSVVSITINAMNKGVANHFVGGAGARGCGGAGVRDYFLC